MEPGNGFNGCSFSCGGIGSVQRIVRVEFAAGARSGDLDVD
jgi:hypothetical protein